LPASPKTFYAVCFYDYVKFFQSHAGARDAALRTVRALARDTDGGVPLSIVAIMKIETGSFDLDRPLDHPDDDTPSIAATSVVIEYIAPDGTVIPAPSDSTC
jgi:hypothetical protein